MSFLRTSVLGAVASSFVLACTASAPAPPSDTSAAVTRNDSDKSGASTKTSGSPPPASGPTPAPAKTGSAPNTAQCAATANHEDCSTCCEGSNSERTKTRDDAFSQCLCNAARASCTAECAAGYCSSPDGTAVATSTAGLGTVDPCASCAPETGTCEPQSEKACAADPTCAAAEKCYADAKCDSKPPGPDEGTAMASDSSNGP
jgi:hypothetical protein